MPAASLKVGLANPARTQASEARSLGAAIVPPLLRNHEPSCDSGFHVFPYWFNTCRFEQTVRVTR